MDAVAARIDAGVLGLAAEVREPRVIAAAGLVGLALASRSAHRS